VLHDELNLINLADDLGLFYVESRKDDNKSLCK
jgi:hypothetical protein